MRRIAVLLLIAIAGSSQSISAESIRNIPVPQGFERVFYPDYTYSGWIQTLPLKTDNSILTYSGKRLPSRVYSRLAVIGLPLLFAEDLEQCADFCMRFWADFHNEAGKLDELYLFSYQGEKELYAASGLVYLDFLRRAFAYSNSHSLKIGSSAFDDPPRPGDMIVQNDTGGIGHVSMIVDACEDQDGKRLYLIGFSFMPAQEFHIEKSPDTIPGADPFGKEGWFSIEGYLDFLDRYYPYGEPVLRRFEEGKK